MTVVRKDFHNKEIHPPTGEAASRRRSARFGITDSNVPIVSDNMRVQQAYEVMRQNGESHNMAEMLATRTFPGTRTDREFNAGRVNGSQFESCPERGDWYRKEAEARGVSTTGKFYHDGLADFPGDPTAWVSDRGDVLRVAREKGLKLSGSVDYEPPGFHDHPGPAFTNAVDPSLIAAEVEQIMESDPGARRGDVEESLIQLRSGAVDPNPLLVRDGNPDDDLVDFS